MKQTLSTTTLISRSTEPILVPKLRISFADFPYLHCSMNQRLLTLETCCGYGYGLERGALPLVIPYETTTAIHHSLTITDFQGPDRVHRTPQEPWCFTTFASLSLAEPIPGIQDLNKKRQLFPRLDTTSVRLFALPLLVL